MPTHGYSTTACRQYSGRVGGHYTPEGGSRALPRCGEAASCSTLPHYNGAVGSGFPLHTAKMGGSGQWDPSVHCRTSQGVILHYCPTVGGSGKWKTWSALSR